MMPHRWNVGDKVVITPACIERMKSSNRSCVTPGYPSDIFINEARSITSVVGVVTHVFPPGYEVTARFSNRSFHMKDNWIEATP
jgi:hypothetical protein